MYVGSPPLSYLAGQGVQLETAVAASSGRTVGLAYMLSFLGPFRPAPGREGFAGPCRFSSSLPTAPELFRKTLLKRKREGVTKRPPSGERKAHQIRCATLAPGLTSSMKRTGRPG